MIYIDIHHAASSTHSLPGNTCAVLLGVEKKSIVYLIVPDGANIDSVIPKVELAVQQHFTQNIKPLASAKKPKLQTPQMEKRYSMRVCVYIKALNQYMDIVTVHAPSLDPNDIEIQYNEDYGPEQNKLLKDLCTDFWKHIHVKPVWYRNPTIAYHYQGAMLNQCFVKPISLNQRTNLVNRVFFTKCLDCDINAVVLDLHTDKFLNKPFIGIFTVLQYSDMDTQCVPYIVYRFHENADRMILPAEVHSILSLEEMKKGLITELEFHFGKRLIPSEWIHKCETGRILSCCECLIKHALLPGIKGEAC